MAHSAFQYAFQRRMIHQCGASPTGDAIRVVVVVAAAAAACQKDPQAWHQDNDPFQPVNIAMFDNRQAKKHGSYYLLCIRDPRALYISMFLVLGKQCRGMHKPCLFFLTC